MFKQLRFLGFFLGLVFVLNAAGDQSVSPAKQNEAAAEKQVEEKAPASTLPKSFKGKIADYFKEKFSKAKVVWGSLLTLLMDDITPYFDKGNYLFSPVFDIEIPEASVELKEDKFEITTEADEKAKEGEKSKLRYDFGYAASGSLAEPFAGMKAQIESPHVIFFLKKPFIGSFNKGPLKQTITLSNVGEFWMKAVLWAKDFEKEKMTPPQAMGELTFLLWKLSKTTKVKQIAGLMGKDMSKQLLPVVSTVTVGGTDLPTFLETYWKIFQEIEKASSLKDAAKEFTVSDFREMMINLIGSLIPLFVEYDKAVAEYEKTPEGAEQHNVILGSTSFQELMLNRQTENKHLTGFAKLKTNIKQRVTQVLKRFGPYGVLKEKCEPVLKTTLDPFLFHAGVSWDDVKPVDAELASGVPHAAQDTIEEIKFGLFEEVAGYPSSSSEEPAQVETPTEEQPAQQTEESAATPAPETNEAEQPAEDAQATTVDAGQTSDVQTSETPAVVPDHDADDVSAKPAVQKSVKKPKKLEKKPVVKPKKKTVKKKPKAVEKPTEEPSAPVESTAQEEPSSQTTADTTPAPDATSSSDAPATSEATAETTPTPAPEESSTTEQSSADVSSDTPTTPEAEAETPSASSETVAEPSTDQPSTTEDPTSASSETPSEG